jgi:hypothetical protein
MLTGTFGKTEIAFPRGRLNGSGGKTTEGKRFCAGAAGAGYRFGITVRSLIAIELSKKSWVVAFNTPHRISGATGEA